MKCMIVDVNNFVSDMTLNFFIIEFYLFISDDFLV